MNYIKETRNRARRRKSRWNLLLLPAVLLPLALMWVGAVFLAVFLHSSFYPGQNLNNATGIGPILVAVSPFFGSLPLSMLLGNVLVRAIPPARQVLDLEAIPFASTSFNAAQAQLRKAALYLVPSSVVICVLGSLLPW